MSTLLFSAIDIAKVIEAVGVDQLMDDTIDGIADACRSYDPPSYEVPVRSGFSYDEGPCKGLVEWMPILKCRDRVLVKMVGYHPDNPKAFSLPTVLSTIVTFDTRSGAAISVIDGTFLTSLRTGAASAVASSVLATPSSTSIGLIGAGAQAVTQLHALSRCFPVREVFVFDTDSQALDSFAQRMTYAGLDALSVHKVDRAHLVRRSDIICTSTSVEIGDGPVFDDEGLKDDVHINAVGSDFPGKTEVPLSVLRRSKVCPDFRDQAVAEGECQQLEPDVIGPELHEIVKNKAQYACWQAEPTVFDSTGWALEDLVAADIFTRIGRQHGCGTPVDFACVADDPRNPYAFIDRFTGTEQRLRTTLAR